MKITVNGEPKEIDSPSVEKMLIELGLNPKVTIVEKNGEIISRERYADVLLAEADVFELIRFMGGG